ncbi:Bacterial membrane flanked domain protein [Streptomyces sp. YIM 130001]|nr:Bacterial membrane flanked domain protein [Streptomyces sp. YIM 130001]
MLVTAYTVPAELPAAQGFVAAYRMHFRACAVPPLAVEAYDAVHFVARGMRETASTGAEQGGTVRFLGKYDEVDEDSPARGRPDPSAAGGTVNSAPRCARIGPMLNAERYLAEDEQLVHATRQHWTEIVGEFAVLVVIWAVVGVLLWVVPSDDWGSTARNIVLALGVIASIWFWLVPLLKWRSTVYVVSTKRIYVRSGFLTKTGHSIPLVRVNDVAFRATLWERILREGTLSIQSASEQGMLTLKHVPDPEGLKQLIHRAVGEEQRGQQQWGGPTGPVPPAY